MKAVADAGYAVDGEISDGAEFFLSRGEVRETLRYVETRRDDEEGANCPRVAAQVDILVQDGWQTLFEVYVHDSYRSVDDDLGHTYPVLEQGWVHASQLYELVSRFGSPTPRAGRAIIDAIGEKTPVHHGMARFHQITPERMGTALEEMYYAVAEERLDEMWEMKEEASALWDDAPASAIPVLEALDQALADESVKPEHAQAIFKARYLIDATIANASGEVKTPVIAAGDTLVRWQRPF